MIEAKSLFTKSEFGIVKISDRIAMLTGLHSISFQCLINEKWKYSF